MIEIPEERLLKDITDLLMNELPKVLLELEEQSADGIRLPPFRYVGLEEKLPVGTGLPYAFVEIEEVEYSEKDRIVKNVKYLMTITINIENPGQRWNYLMAFDEVINKKRNITYKIQITSKNRTSKIKLLVSKTKIS